MKHLYILLAGSVLLFSSCSSTQRVAQTPDDVYYSPGASKTVAAASGENPEYYSTAPSDNYVRLKSRNYNRWAYFDEYDAYDSYYAPSVSVGIGSYYGMGYGYPYYGGFGYSPFYGMGMSFWDPYLSWNTYFTWNCWYNPYFYNPYYGGGVVIVNPKAPTNNVYTHLRSFNGVSYRNGSSGAGSGQRFYRPSNTGTQSYYNPGSRSGNNTYYRPVTTNSNNNYNNGSYNRPAPSFNNQPVRSYSPAPVGGGGGGGFSRPGRH